VRILSQDRDVYLDLEGGNRIPKFGEARARSIGQLREAGLGVRHVMFVHFNTVESSDLFEVVLTMLDPNLTLTVVGLHAPATNGPDWIQQGLARAEQLHRKVALRDLNHDDPAAAVLRLALEDHCDLIVLGGSSETEQTPPVDTHQILRHAPCRVCLITPPGIPQEVA